MLLRARLLLLAVVVGAISSQLFLDGRVSEGWMILVNIVCGLLVFAATVVFVSLFFRIHKADGKFYYDARNPLWMAIKFFNNDDKEIRLCKMFWQIVMLTVFVSFLMCGLAGAILAITQFVQSPRHVSGAEIKGFSMAMGMVLAGVVSFGLVLYGLGTLADKSKIVLRIVQVFVCLCLTVVAIAFLVLAPISVQLNKKISLPTAVQNDLLGLAALAFAVVLAILAFKLFKVLRNTALGELLANELCPTLEELPGTEA